MPRLCQRLTEFRDRHDNAQPGVGGIVIAPTAHLPYDLNRSRGGPATAKLDDAMGAAMNGEVGNGHDSTVG